GPAGKVVAANLGGDLWELNQDGSGRVEVVPQAHNILSLSVCGDRYLLFDRYLDGKVELWRADIDGSNAAKTLDGADASDCSPDGKPTYYTVKNPIQRRPVGGGAPAQIMTVPGTSHMRFVAVSPDGQQAAFYFQEGSPIPALKIGVASLAQGTLMFSR